MLYSRLVERFFSFQRIPVKAIAVTALASYLLQITGILRDDPLYLIALYTLLPWIPIVFLEGIWKVEHYTWMAVFGILAVVQIGHFGEHVIQVAQIEVFDGSLACPPPVDNAENASRAVEAGLRQASHQPTGASTQWVFQPGADGLVALDANGSPTKGPAACGVFGQLDLEGVHLGWELIGWFGTLFLLTKFRRNLGLWLAAGFLSWHALEHLSISWMFYLDRDLVYEGVRQLWATTAEGNIITAHPVGLAPAEVNFYNAGGKNGLLARGGLFETLFGLSGVMPTRPNLHMFYNLFITVPTLAGFLYQVRRIYDEYLAVALPTLSEEELVKATSAVENRMFKNGDTIIRQGDVADNFYIISKGEVLVQRTDEGGHTVEIGRLEKGSYFGEIGLLHGGRRTASVIAVGNVEVLAMPGQVFSRLIDHSDSTKSQIGKVVEDRLAEQKS